MSDALAAVPARRLNTMAVTALEARDALSRGDMHGVASGLERLTRDSRDLVAMCPPELPRSVRRNANGE
jgi:hypothetical protein